MKKKNEKSKLKYFFKKIPVGGIFKGFLTVLISVLMIFTVAKAGTITPPSGSPVATFYTISQIYEFITNNTTATEGDHSFTFSNTLAGTGYTLTEIYTALENLISADKVKLGTTYLNVAGTLVPSGGTATSTNVLSGKTYFGDSQTDWSLQTGSMADNGTFSLTASSTDQSITGGYYSGGTLLGDADLITTNIKSGINIFGINGDSNVVDTSSGDAVAGDLLSGKIAWAGGLSIIGTIPTQTLSSDNDTVLGGYYATTTLSTIDTDLVAGNILSGATIFGIPGNVSAGYTYGDSNQAYVLGTATGAGTALKNMYNGSATSGDYPQSVGGVDDYNANGALPGDSYVSTWTTCNAGNSYCGTNTSTAYAKDNSTGLIWSGRLDGGAFKTWFWANNAKYPNGLPGDDGVCNLSGEVACKVVKLTDGDVGGKTGCEALGTGWRLPYQKELMQTYIDGSWGIIVTAGSSDWSATTLSFVTQNAWVSNLTNGSMGNALKTNNTTYRVMCVL